MSGLDAQLSPGIAGEQRNAPTGEQSPRAKANRYFRQVLFMRRQRDKRFSQDFSTDRGWDLLLLLMIARLEERLMKAGELFDEKNPHGVTLEELDRQLGFGNVVMMDAGEDLEGSQIALSDEAARHLIDLFRIDAATE